MDFRRPILDDPKGFPISRLPFRPLPGELPSLRAGWEEAGRDANDDASEVWGTTPGKRGMRRMARAVWQNRKKHSFFLQNGDWSEGLTAKLDFDYIINHHLIFWSCFIMYLTMSQMMCVQNWDETWSLRVNLTAGPRKIWRWALYLRGAQRPLGEG